MHKITDKLHRNKGATEHIPATFAQSSIAPNTVLLNKEYVSNAQGAYFQPTLQQTTTTTLPVQQTFTQNTTFVQTAPVQTTTFTSQQYAQNIEAVHVHTLAPVVETRIRPAIIEQTTRIDKVTQIQPIVHREIEQPRVHLLEQHIYETVPSIGPSVITNQAIVEEVVRPRVLEQIQPILHRDVAAPFIERVEQHTTEHIVQPATTTKQVFSETRALSLEEASARGFSAPALPVVSTAPVVHTTTAAPLLESRTRNTIVEQTLRAEKITEIQPIIHREIDAPQVHLIEKHSYEKVRSSGPGLVTNQAIVQETVRPHIVEQIQPIVHRSVPAPFVEKVEQHTTEHVVAPTQTSKQILTERSIAAPVQISQQREIGAPIIQHTEAAPVLESRTRNTIVEQTLRPERITEIQPIVHREIDAPQVRVIEKHSYEKVRSSGPGLITNQPIIQETVKPHIVEQIQPIVHRSVPAPFVEKVEQHTTEHVVAPTQTTKQVLTERSIAAPVQISQQREIGAPTIHHTEAAPVIENRTRAAIVEQTLRPERITEIQPIVHREIDAPQVRVIEKHSYEKVRSSGPGLITNQAIVQETVRPHIVEQIQPIVHRSVPAPFVEKVEQHTTEHVVAPTQTTKQVLTERSIAAPVQISQQREIGAPTIHHTEVAPVIENRTRAAIVEQTVRPEKITEIQPIVHREIDAPQVRLIEKHSYEKVSSSGPSMITNQAIVQETVKPHIVEQIQPIVHRSVPAPFVEKVEQHTTERVVAPTQTTKQILTERSVAAPVQISRQKEIGAPTILHTEAAPVLENRTRAAIVEQTVRPEKITEIQPIVHREIDAPQVRVIEKHSYEKVRSSGPSMITNQAIVQETVRPHIVEQIQPIVHRSVPAPFVEKVEQHTTERVVAPTQTTKQVLTERSVAAPVQISHQKEIGAPTIHHTEAAPVVENRTRAAIIEQTARPEKITEIQPIVHREIDAPQVRLIEKHSYEKVRSSGPGLVTNRAIVQETVRPHIVEQIQPIVHRSVPAPFVEKVEQHTTEHVVAPTQTSKRILTERSVAAPVQISHQKEIGAPTIHHTEVAPVVENRTRSAIVEQTVRPEKITEIQPIVHREIDAPQVRLIEKHSYEKVRSTGPSTITRGAIVEETVIPRVIEEIQPIIHRNVAQTVVERVEQHTTEHIVAPTQTTKQVVSEQRTAAAVPLPAAITAQRSTVPVVHSSTAQTVTESFTKPALVEQTTRAEKITQVQPIIHRQIDAPEVHLIEKHMYEKVPSQGPSLITNQTIVEETVRPRIVEEIQPVVHRSVPAAFVERVEQHTTEHLVAPTISTKEVIVEKRAAAPLVSAVAAGTLPSGSTTTRTTTTETTTHGLKRLF